MESHKKQYNYVKQFTDIYDKKMWIGGGSGSGSSPILLKGYMRFLSEFIKLNNIKTISDVGCGDWQFSKLLDFSEIDKYIGYDVVESLIQKNIREFKKHNIDFKYYTGNFDEVEGADLVICKDVLQHLPDSEIHKFLKILPKFKYALIANDTSTYKEKLNKPLEQDILLSGCGRTLDLKLPPFSLDCKTVYKIDRSFERRHTILVELWCADWAGVKIPAVE